MIRAPCPECRTPIEIPDSQAGKVEICGHCGKKIILTSWNEPPPQADLVSSALLRYSRDFYDRYEDIRESITGQHQVLDEAVLFESMAFFMFILDFSLFHSEQSDGTSDYIYEICEGLAVCLCTEHPENAFGSPQQIRESVRHRVREYAEFMRDNGNQNPVVFFTGTYSPLYNFMMASREADSISPENAPIVIEDIFVHIATREAWGQACLEIVGPFFIGLHKLFGDNQNFLALPEAEVERRLSIGKGQG